jgi:DNA-binding transcriptional regulator YdaS (Cro superfamily)
MGKTALADVPRAAARTTSAAAAHPYAKYLHNVTASTAERVLAGDPICTPDTDAFARAVKNCGGILSSAERTGDAGESILEAIFGGVTPAAWLCVDIERACSGSVKVEEMRDDLVWFRDGAGEIIGFAEPLDHSKRELELAIRGSREDVAAGALIDGQWDAASYRAGMLRAVDSAEVNRLLTGTYAGVTDWSSADALDSLMAVVDEWRSDSAYHMCHGMLWDLDDTTRDGLLDECGVMYARDWSVAKTAALWEKAQAIRSIHPANSTIAALAHAQGIVSVADDHALVTQLVDFHGLASDEPWTPERFDSLIEHTRAVVLKDMLKIEREATPGWSDLLLGYSYGMRKAVDADDAERYAKAAANLLDEILPGIRAIHNIQWVALDSPDADGIDQRSTRNLAVFLGSLQEFAHLLVNMRDNMIYRQRELEA